MQLLQRSHPEEEYVISREKKKEGVFVTKTYTGPDAIKNAARAVHNFELIKDAGVARRPSTFRLSDTDPRIVIAQLLVDEDHWLLSSNSMPKSDEMRPISFDMGSFHTMLDTLKSELQKMSESGIEITDPDAIFFELPKVGQENTPVNFFFGDFDTPSLGFDPEMTMQENVTQMMKALFTLILSQKLDKSANAETRDFRWAEVLTQIQLWGSEFNVDARAVYRTWIAEVKARARQADKKQA